MEKTGFSVLLLFILAAAGTYFVYDALARMIAQHAEQGSFKAYSKNAFGHWAGFNHGWMYWLSEMLILGSQLMAIGLFTRFWFDQVPLWIFSAGYAVLGVVVVFLGTKVFEKAENIFAVLKITAIVMFIGLSILVMTGVLSKTHDHMHTPSGAGEWFTQGPMGMWTAFLYVFFAFSGIEVMGLMATHLKNPKDAPKSGKAMIITITLLYIASISLAMLLAPLKRFNPNESPFVTSLKDIDFMLIVHIFNGVLIIAGFSSLVASLFSVTQIMHKIAVDGDAPHILTRKTKRGLPIASLVLTVSGMIVSILIALLLPKKVYEYITTAGGLMLLYTWLFIVFSSRKLLKMSVWGHVKSFAAIVLVLAAASGTVFDRTSRPGFFASLILVLVIGIITFILRKRWKGERPNKPI
ncbi:amino acid permease [Marinicrinis lubricantis]